jgi:hypothetical protein
MIVPISRVIQELRYIPKATWTGSDPAKPPIIRPRQPPEISSLASIQFLMMRGMLCHLRRCGRRRSPALGATLRRAPVVVGMAVIQALTHWPGIPHSIVVGRDGAYTFRSPAY